MTLTGYKQPSNRLYQIQSNQEGVRKLQLKCRRKQWPWRASIQAINLSRDIEKRSNNY